MPAGTLGGFTYIGLLLALAVSTTALAAAGVVWHTATQRAKEAELVFVGGEFKRAIASYYNGTPGPVKQLPKKLEDLLLDNRYPTVRRYLRKIYVDPMTGKDEWGLVATPAGIVGVYSLSEREPFKNRAASSAPSARSTSPAASTVSEARRATKYSDWKFVAELEQPLAPIGTVAPSPLVPVPQPVVQAPSAGALAQAIPQTPRPELSTGPSVK